QLTCPAHTVFTSDGAAEEKGVHLEQLTEGAGCTVRGRLRCEHSSVEVRVNNVLLPFSESVILEHGDIVRITDPAQPFALSPLAAFQFFYTAQPYLPYSWKEAQDLKQCDAHVVCSGLRNSEPHALSEVQPQLLKHGESSMPTYTLKVVRMDD